MKKLPFIIFALLLIGCSDNGVGVEPEPEFEPYIIEDFLVVSPDEARAVGSDYKLKTTRSKGDTVTLSNPDRWGLTIERNEHRDYEDNGELWKDFRVIFIDSTYTHDDSISLDNSFIDHNWEDSNYLRTHGGGIGVGPDYVEAQSKVFYNCSSSQVGSIDFTVNYFTNDSTHVVTYDFDLEGMVDVFDDLGC